MKTRIQERAEKITALKQELEIDAATRKRFSKPTAMIEVDDQGRAVRGVGFTKKLSRKRLQELLDEMR